MENAFGTLRIISKFLLHNHFSLIRHKFILYMLIFFAKLLYDGNPKYKIIEANEIGNEETSQVRSQREHREESRQ